MEKAKEIAGRHPGEVPVYMKIQDEGIALLLSREYWCDGEEPVLEAFRALCGSEGVVIRG